WSLGSTLRSADSGLALSLANLPVIVQRPSTMAADHITCGGCSAVLKLPQEATPGRTIRCPKCGQMMPVLAATKEEFLEVDLLDRMKDLEGMRIRAEKKRPRGPLPRPAAPEARLEGPSPRQDTRLPTRARGLS